MATEARRGLCGFLALCGFRRAPRFGHSWGAREADEDQQRQVRRGCFLIGMFLLFREALLGRAGEGVRPRRQERAGRLPRRCGHPAGATGSRAGDDNTKPCKYYGIMFRLVRQSGVCSVCSSI